jgi:RNase P protein component
MRAGFAITGVRRAVDRNRVRRRFRALLAQRLGALAGLDLLISAGPPAVHAAFLQIGADLDACLTGVVPRAVARVAGNGAESGGRRASRSGQDQ